MGPKITSAQRRSVIEALDNDKSLAKLLVAMVEAARRPALESKSADALGKAAEVLPAVSRRKMMADLRADDCLYDDRKIWKQLGAKNIPKLPDDVIRKAWRTGGRIVLHDPSISRQADALRAAGNSVCFWGGAKQEHYTAPVSKPEWIVIPSHIDRKTLHKPKKEVITADSPAPTPGAWFSALAYARLDGGRQPEGVEGLFAFTTESGTVVGAGGDYFYVNRRDSDDIGIDGIGAARFGPPRN
jgi:hypothetical protein